MTAPIGTALNRFTGIRELGQVTNSYGGYLQSAGASTYDLELPFRPDRFDWFRYTGFGTAGVLGQGVWFRDFPAGDSLILRSIADNGSTGNTSQLLETSNGITDASTAGGFYNEHLVISAITTATPGVVTTTTNHNLSDNDRVVLTKIIGTAAAQLNNNTYVVRVLSATTFALYDIYGVPVTVVGAYSSSGQVTKIGPLLGDPSQPVNPAYPHRAIIDYPPTYILTLGTAIMGTDNDIIYFTAWQFNNYVNIGDVA
jgi:hypothetical protein